MARMQINIRKGVEGRKREREIDRALEREKLRIPRWEGYAAQKRKKNVSDKTAETP